MLFRSWLAKGAVERRWRGFQVCGAEEEEAVVTRRASVWEVSVSGVCLPACLPLCCSEGGRGWACSCLGRAAPAWDTALLSGYRLTASLPAHLDSQRGASGQARTSEKIVEVSFSRQSSQPSGRCSGTGPGGGQPLEGCGDLRLGVSWAMMHPRSLHPKLQDGGEGSEAQGSQIGRAHV